MKNIQYKKTLMCSLLFMLSLSILLPEQVPSQYAQEYAAVMQDPESSINKRAALLATTSSKIPLDYYRLLLAMDVNTFIYTNSDGFSSDKEEVVEITSWQNLLSQTIDFICQQTNHISREPANISLMLPTEFPFLYAYIDGIAQKNNIPCPLVLLVHDDNFINAAADGDTSQRGIIAIGRSFINRLSEQSLETVIAHEIGHIVNNDIPSRRRVNRLFAPVYPLLPTAIFVAGSLISHVILFGILVRASEDRDNCVRVPCPGTLLLFSITTILPAGALKLGFLWYNKYCLTSQENKADDFAKEQGCNAADGIDELEKVLSKSKKQAFNTYSKVLDKYYQDYISKSDYNAKAAQNIKTTITLFKKQQKQIIEYTGFHLSREQRISRLR